MNIYFGIWLSGFVLAALIYVVLYFFEPMFSQIFKHKIAKKEDGFIKGFIFILFLDCLFSWICAIMITYRYVFNRKVTKQKIEEAYKDIADLEEATERRLNWTPPPPREVQIMTDEQQDHWLVEVNKDLIEQLEAEREKYQRFINDDVFKMTAIALVQHNNMESTEDFIKWAKKKLNNTTDNEEA